MRRDEGHLVAAGEGQLPQGRAQPQAGIARGFPGRTAEARHRPRPREEAADVHPQQGRRHQAERRQRAVAAAHVRRGVEHFPEAPLAGQLLQRRARIGDRHEMPAPVGHTRQQVPEVIEEGERLRRGARLARHQKKALFRIEARRQRVHRFGMGAVQHRHRGTAERRAERPREHLGRQARSAHAEHHGVAEAFLRHLAAEPRQPARLGHHRIRQRQPPQPVCQLGDRLRRPELMILFPETPAESLLLPLRQPRLDRCLVRPQPEICSLAHPGASFRGVPYISRPPSRGRATIRPRRRERCGERSNGTSPWPAEPF